MKTKILSFSLLLSMACFAQDEIHTRYNAIIKGKVRSEGGAILRYTKADVPGNDYVIDKGDIKEIKYGDGRSVTYPVDIYENVSLSETESRIKNIIDSNGYDNEKSQTRLKAEFQNGKLVVSGGDMRGDTYDFKDVKSFPPVGKKTDDRANVSVWVMGADKPTSSKWEKRRLIFLVHGQDNAYELYNLMKHLNLLLKAQK